MDRKKLISLAERIEEADEVDAGLSAEAVEAIATAFGGPGELLTPDAPVLSSTDRALHVVDAIVPAWEITMKGLAREPDGHWTCTLREGAAQDDDEVIGVGKAPSLPRALIAALLKVAAQRAG